MVPIPPVWFLDSSFTISLTYQHYYKMITQPGCPRAPVLYETSDGSPHEYKNVENLCSAAYKVLTNMFEEVYLYFLPPGHSHDLQDQAWRHLKRAFYSSRVITWNDLLRVLSGAFPTFKPEIIPDILIFDWKEYFRPWRNLISHHSKWRAFKFFKHPQHANTVMMMWKENEFSAEPFHGSNEHPDGIELLLQIPPGVPKRIFPAEIDMAKLDKILQTFPNFSPSERLWWEELLSSESVPNYENVAVPEDYFDHEKLSYRVWSERNPFVFQQAATLQAGLQQIVVDKDRGVRIASANYIELFIGDFISYQSDEHLFEVGKIRNITIHPTSGKAVYNIWKFTTENAEDGRDDHQTKWKAIKLTSTEAQCNINSEEILTAQFHFGRGNKLKQATISLITETLGNINTFFDDGINFSNENTPHVEQVIIIYA